MRGGVSDDHDLAACGRLGDRLADQGSDVLGPHDFDGGRRRQRPGVPASLGERIEQAPRERLAALLVGDLSRPEAPRGGSSGNDVLVDVEIAEPLRDLFPDLVSATASSPAGAEKAGQPQPESYFASESNSSAPQPAHRYVPGSKTWSYSPLNGASVPLSRRTRYSSGVNSSRHSCSVFSTFAT